jgi:dTDP-L-rhamnose 4-epimerase
MRKRVLITGGAGFIGSHVTDLLLASGYSVRILDCLTSQVHGLSGTAPGYLNRDAELIVGDVRDANAVARALEVSMRCFISRPSWASARACMTWCRTFR